MSGLFDDHVSALRTRITDAVIESAECFKATMRACVTRSEPVGRCRAAQHQSQVRGGDHRSVAETIERWDAEEASRRIELHVGRGTHDSWINGTLVGAWQGWRSMRSRNCCLSRC